MSDRLNDISEVLPFWVNGSLDAAESARVEQALAGSAELRAEAEELRALRQDMRSVPMAAGPGDLGLARLMRAIDAETVAPKTYDTRYNLQRMAASVAVAAVLSSLATYGVMRGGENAPALYEQASGEDLEATLTVSFKPEATEAAISALLREKGLVIVDGPSAIGLYRIALPLDITSDDATRYLADATSIIGHVELTE